MKTMMDFILAATTKEPEQPSPRKESAINISSILSGFYRQKSESEWKWLQINRPEWWARRAKLENEVDGHCLAGNPEAAQEHFYQLVEHLKAAPIDKLSSRIARQLDNLSTTAQIDTIN